jgi:hypothetical protein
MAGGPGPLLPECLLYFQLKDLQGEEVRIQCLVDGSVLLPLGWVPFLACVAFLSSIVCPQWPMTNPFSSFQIPGELMSQHLSVGRCPSWL